MKKHSLLDSFPVWLYYPSLIKWKIENRNSLDKKNKDYLISTINSSIITDLATFIEGISFEMITGTLFDRLQHGKEKFNNSLIDHFDKKLSRAGWNDYVEYYNLLLGGKLNEKIESENWKAIMLLFNYRNMLVHGKETEIHYYEDSGTLKSESPYAHKNIFDFLQIKGLLDQSHFPILNSIDMLNNEVVSFFYENTIFFIKNVFDLFPDSEVNELRVNFNECLEF